MREISFELTSSSLHRKCCRLCSHSKYETVTPPAFARMSGTTKIPRSARIESASRSVGPFAASTRMRHWTRAAFSAVIWRSIAAGISTSHASVRRSAFDTGSAFGKPSRKRCSAIQRSTSAMSSPRGSWIPERTSETATIRAPRCRAMRAVFAPTLP